MYLNTGLGRVAAVAPPQWNYRGRPGARAGVLIRVPVVLAKPKGFGAYKPVRRYKRRGMGDAASILAEQTNDQTNPFLTPAYYATVAADNNNECAVDPSSSACQVWQLIQAPTIAQTNENATQLDLANYCEQNVFNNSQFGDPLDTTSCNGSQPVASVVAAATKQGSQAPAWQTQPSSNAPTGTGASIVPTVTLSNVSRPGQPLAVGDSFSLLIHGSPNSPVLGTASQNGTSLGSTPYGTTDGAGNKTITGTMAASNVGSWSEVWTVGTGVAPTLSFTVSAAPGSPSGTTTQQTPAPAPGGTTNGTSTTAPVASTPDLSSLLGGDVNLFGYNIPVLGLGAAAIAALVLFSGRGR